MSLDGASNLASGLYAVPAGTAIASTGLPAGLKAGMPAFSPDGKHLAFNLQAGPGADQRTLALMDFNPATKAFAKSR